MNPWHFTPHGKNSFCLQGSVSAFYECANIKLAGTYFESFTFFQ